MIKPVTTDEALGYAYLIVQRCQGEGAADHRAGVGYDDCPYIEELERSAWLDGWSKAQ